jgi:hypothetical protein
MTEHVKRGKWTTRHGVGEPFIETAVAGGDGDRELEEEEPKHKLSIFQKIPEEPPPEKPPNEKPSKPAPTNCFIRLRHYIGDSIIHTNTHVFGAAKAVFVSSLCQY